jgi:arylformamidase
MVKLAIFCQDGDLDGMQYHHAMSARSPFLPGRDNRGAAVTSLDLEAEYNNRARVPDFARIVDGWLADAAEYRQQAAFERRAELSLEYGGRPRQTIDLFWPDKLRRDGPLAVFIHGGYWQSRDPSDFSHVARGANARGLAVALVGYDLCPDVSVATIVDQIRAAILFLYRRHGRRITVFGHSAGGHLTGCMVATNWRTLAPDVPADLVPAGLAISGLFELQPLLKTSVNAKLGLDAAEARRLSPAFWPVLPGRRLEAWVGGVESPEYLRQSRSVVSNWTGAGNAASYHEVPDANHFTVIAPLSDPKSPMVDHLIGLGGKVA